MLFLIVKRYQKTAKEAGMERRKSKKTGLISFP
jgi:hypothetical protein